MLQCRKSGNWVAMLVAYITAFGVIISLGNSDLKYSVPRLWTLLVLAFGVAHIMANQHAQAATLILACEFFFWLRFTIVNFILAFQFFFVFLKDVQVASIAVVIVYGLKLF